MISLTKKIELFFIKIFRYEFWPYYIFYFPAFFYGFILALRSGSITYFIAANPVMKYGGAFGMSKSELINKLNTSYIPQTILVKPPYIFEYISKLLVDHDLHFPIILKPDVGERGEQVEKVDSKEQLKTILNKNEDFIIQEFVDFENEIGVLYYRFPGKDKGHISSIVKRKLLVLKGDGKHTLSQLIKKNTRALLRKDYLYEKFENELDKVLADNEELVLEPIGNHNRGTEFQNGNHLINDELISVFDKISKDLDGFYYGRFDLKYKTPKELYKGRNIKILEINGVNSEPAHIYDPSYKLFRAYRDIFFHMNIIYKIAKHNRFLGAQKVSFKIFYKDMRQHMRKTKWV